MFDALQKSAGAGYSTTVALLVVALIFGPLVLLVARPFSYLSLSMAVASSLLCLIWARVNWISSSRLSLHSIETQNGAAK
jgi:hypothetical protein